VSCILEQLGLETGEGQSYSEGCHEESRHSPRHVEEVMTGSG
jgi:hypothetical protein